jgi:hypothetical protein
MIKPVFVQWGDILLLKKKCKSDMDKTVFCSVLPEVHQKNLPSRSNWISPLDQCLPVRILQNVFAEQSWKISCSNWQLRLKSLTNSHLEGPTKNSRSGQKVVVKTVHTCHVQHVNVFCEIWVTPPKKTEQFWFNTSISPLTLR